MGKARRRTLLYGMAVVLAAGLLLAGFGITLPPDAETRLNGAALLGGAGDFEGALEICAIVLREHPDNLDARVFRATFLAAAGRRGEAMAALDDAIAHAGADAAIRIDLRQDRAALLLEEGREAEFRRERDALARDGLARPVHVLDGMAATRRADWKTAVDQYRRALDLGPGDAQVSARLWAALMEQGKEGIAARRFEEARECFDAARKLHPDASAAHLRAVEVRLAMQDVDGAVEVLRELASSTPGVAPLAFRAATALLERGDRERAIFVLSGAVAADPAGTRVLLGRESSWAPFRSDRAVEALFEGTEERTAGAGLTGTR
jgi:tetratricopeptide (TPR) repeat protein